MVVDVLGDAAQPVAAHFRLAAVGVVHPHPRVGLPRRANQDQAVAADAEMPVADRARERCRISGEPLGETIDVNVIVAAALHFGEAHGLLPGTLSRKPRSVTPILSLPAACC